eukprot:scaffold5295_cov215-Skeletonema_marinoi.AAC.3
MTLRSVGTKWLLETSEVLCLSFLPSKKIGLSPVRGCRGRGRGSPAGEAPRPRDPLPRGQMGIERSPFNPKPNAA